MAQPEKRNLIDELADRVRGLLEDLDRLLQPGDKEPARAPVPVRVPKSDQHRSR